MKAINTKFEPNNVYEMCFIGDSQLKPKYICVKRTEKTATFQRFQHPEDEIKRRIKLDSYNSEYVLDGNYSMAPSISSRKVVM